VRRRTFIAAGVIAAFDVIPSSATKAQMRLSRVGFLHPRLSAIVEPLRVAAVRDGLLSASPGSRIEMIVRVADGSSERLRMFAQELASERLDVLVAVAPSGIAAAREASRTTPIVGVDLETDPVAAGWIASLSRPGGNVTGVFLDMPEFAAKCLQMLMEVVGRRVSIGVLWDPSTGGYQRASVEPAAASMGLELKLRETAALSDVGPAVYSLAAEGVGGLLILSSPLFSANTTAVAALTTASRLPAIMLFPEFARDGGLIGYGPDLQDLFRRAGIMARRVIDGTPPAEVPVERPVRFSLIVNVRAARTVGVDVPPTLLARADEVIE
jgi:putative tryptophan/tyrosine transport system substrate-binding protein